MFEQIKKSPLLGVALAVCCGYLLARVILRTGGYLWESFLGNSINGWMLFDLAFLGGVVFLTRWLYRRHGKYALGWLRTHRNKVVPGSLLAVMLLGIAALAVHNEIERRQQKSDQWEQQLVDHMNAERKTSKPLTPSK